MKMYPAAVMLALMMCATSIVNAQTSKTKPEPYVNKALLEQNKPNPFSSCTHVTFCLPDTLQSAFIKVYSKKGKELKSFDVTSETEKMPVVDMEQPNKPAGEISTGEITICSDSLSAGTYSYSLFIDGKVVRTRQMIVAK